MIRNLAQWNVAKRINAMSEADYPLDSPEGVGDPEKEAEATGAGGEAQQHDDPSDGVIVHVPAAVMKQYETDQKEQRRRDDRRYCLEVCALLVAAAYAVLTFGLWRTSQDSATAAQDSAKASQTQAALMREQFDIAQRPHIEPEHAELGDVETTLEFVVLSDGIRRVTVTAASVGPGIAYRLSTEAWYYDITSPVGVLDAETMRAAGQGVAMQLNKTVAVAPGDNISGSIMIPNSVFTTIAKRGGGAICVFGWIDYCDSLGIRRRTPFCWTFMLYPWSKQGGIRGDQALKKVPALSDTRCEG